MLISKFLYINIICIFGNLLLAYFCTISIFWLWFGYLPTYQLQVLSPLFSNIIMAREPDRVIPGEAFKLQKWWVPPDCLGGFTLEKRHPVGWNIHTPRFFFSFGTPKFMEVWMVQMIFRISIGMIFGFQPLLFRGVHCEKNHSNRFWRFFCCRVEVFVSFCELKKP